MPDTTSTTPSESTDSAEKKGGPPRLIIVGVLCAVIAGGGFVLGGKVLGGGEPAEAAEVEEPVHEPEVTTILELDAINVNLAGGHYLRIAVALGLDEHILAEEHAEEGADEEGVPCASSHCSAAAGDPDAPPIETAPARDLILSTFAGRTIEHLSTPEGREEARHDLHEGLENFYGEGVLNVLFTEFVMQ